MLIAVLDDSGKAALQNYLDLGGLFIAVHAASDGLRNTTFYGREVGKLFSLKSFVRIVFMVTLHQGLFSRIIPQFRMRYATTSSRFPLGLNGFGI
jgi:hypothetical protein